ncbi:hypothetical protein REPUB_Repub01dG0135600 [Reevesia pubescens]
MVVHQLEAVSLLFSSTISLSRFIGDGSRRSLHIMEKWLMFSYQKNKVAWVRDTVLFVLLIVLMHSLQLED